MLSLALHYTPLRHKGNFPKILVFTLFFKLALVRMEEGKQHSWEVKKSKRLCTGL